MSSLLFKKDYLEKLAPKERGRIAAIMLVLFVLSFWILLILSPTIMALLGFSIKASFLIITYLVKLLIALIPILWTVLLVIFATCTLHFIFDNWSYLKMLCPKKEEAEEIENEDEKKVETRGRKKGGKNAPKIEEVPETKKDETKQD